ncbi:MAG: hypothetical protein WAT23_08625, partial [Chromatiaceae bacterium]
AQALAQASAQEQSEAARALDEARQAQERLNAAEDKARKALERAKTLTEQGGDIGTTEAPPTPDTAAHDASLSKASSTPHSSQAPARPATPKKPLIRPAVPSGRKN